MNINFNYYKDYKPIPNYEFYIINKKGNVINTKTGTYLKQSLNKYGYYRVALCKNGKAKTIYIHTLVAKVFIPNPNNYKIVNHKDENKTNNNVENLEWCDIKYNHNYGNALIKNGKAHRKPITARNGIYKIIADSFKTLSSYLNIKSNANNYINNNFKCKGYNLSRSSQEEIDLLGNNELIKLNQED